MPQIFSISGSFFGSASWDNPAIWYGGVVPTSSDQVFIRGIRTTMNGLYLPWTGSAFNISVGSTVGFPTSSSFYTYTDRDEELKINYVTCSATQFISCSVDTSFFSWSVDIFPITQSFPSKKGGIIPNGAFVQFKPGQIQITGGMFISASTSASNVPAITIETGGELKMFSGSTLALNGRMEINDGTFEMSGSCDFLFGRNYPFQVTESFSTNVNGIYANNFPLQKFIVRGPEVRTNSPLSQSVAIGDPYITLNSVSGFEVGDQIFVGEQYLSMSRTDNGIFGAYSCLVSSTDEVFEVAFKDVPNKRLYIERMNGLEGVIKATASANELIVDEERFKVGDKVNINGQTRTITSVTSSYDFLLKDYDFQSGATLSEWDTDITRSFYFSDWTIYPGLGLTQFTSTAYRHLFVKNLMLDNVKVEAYMSNLRNVVNGSGSRGEYGVLIQSEPGSDYDQAAPTSTNYPQRTALSIEPQFSRAWVTQKNYSARFQTNIYTGSYAIDGPKKFTLESVKGFTRGYINDNLFWEEINRAGSTWGRVGLYSNGNNCVVCTRFVVYAKYTKITLDSNITVAVGDMVRETGAEYPHSAGHQVIKLASTVTDPLEHKDLAFAYRGADEYDNTGRFPYIWANNSSGSRNQDQFNYWRLTADYGQTYNYGSATSRSVIIDLGEPVTFNNIGFIDNYISILQNFTQSDAIRFSGSNAITGSLLFPTASNWVALTSSIIDPRFRQTGETFRSFNVGPQTYRWVRIESNGATRSDLRTEFRGLRIRNNVSNSLALNNVSDINIGDEIQILTRNNIQPYADLGRYWLQQSVTSSTTTASFLDTFTQHYKVVNKSASVIYLDRPFEEGNIEKGAFVVKLNRELKFSGSFDSGSANWKVGKILVAGNGSQQPVRRILFDNVSFQHINGSFPYYGAGGNSIFNGFTLTEANWFNYMGLTQGCTFYNHYNYNASGFSMGYWQSRAGFGTRHCVIVGQTLISLNGYNGYGASSPSVATANFLYGVASQVGFQSSYSTQHIYSYNYILGSTIMTPGYTGFNVGRAQSTFGTTYITERNLIAGSNANVTYGLYKQNLDTQAHFVIRNNRIEMNNAINGQVFISTFMDKALENPFILPKRGGYDFKRATPTNYNSNALASVFSQSYTDLPSHNIGGYYKDINRQGYNIWAVMTGTWLKTESDPYYRHYKHFISSVSNDWRQPILGAYFWLGPGVSASFDMNFDYYQTQNIVWQTEGQFSGSLYILALKNGAEIQEQYTLTKSTTPVNFNRSWDLVGPGFFQFGIAGHDTRAGYVGINNVTSRLSVSESQESQVFSNNLNMRYFDRNDKTWAKTMFNQTPGEQKFRLKGARLF
jgi:hypothetical protein